MTKSVSLATRLKIAASLKGNKNAYRGGPKARLSTREKVANINARAKGGNLSAEQKARRSAVAKRLRAQARKEESLGKTNSTPHAGVANKTPEMKHASSRAAGNIPKLKSETANKPSLPSVPSKSQPAPKASGNDIRRAEGELHGRTTTVKSETYDQRAKRTDEFFSDSPERRASVKRMAAYKAAKAQGPDSAYSEDFSSNLNQGMTTGMGKQSAARPVSAAQIKRAEVELTNRRDQWKIARTVLASMEKDKTTPSSALDTQLARVKKLSNDFTKLDSDVRVLKNRFDNKQKAANTVAKANSPSSKFSETHRKNQIAEINGQISDLNSRSSGARSAAERLVFSTRLEALEKRRKALNNG